LEDGMAIPVTAVLPVDWKYFVYHLKMENRKAKMNPIVQEFGNLIQFAHE